MWTTTPGQAKRYDRGYEDAIEGRKPRSNHPDYLRGYNWAKQHHSEEAGS
jgi:hypothetical protein